MRSTTSVSLRADNSGGWELITQNVYDVCRYQILLSEWDVIEIMMEWVSISVTQLLWKKGFTHPVCLELGTPWHAFTLCLVITYVMIPFTHHGVVTNVWWLIQPKPFSIQDCNITQRTSDAIITSLLCQNDVAMSFWHNNNVIITSCVLWAVTTRWRYHSRALNHQVVSLCTYTCTHSCIITVTS